MDKNMKSMQEGMRMLMGNATLAMMVFPIWINSAAEKFSMDRVKVNQVPQKTPVTSVKRNKDIN
jgi:hypothetical protein